MRSLRTREKATAMIPYGRQFIDQADIDAVEAVLCSDWLTQGPEIERFEQAVAEHCDAAHAVAVSNATAALHIAAQALGLGPRKRLWTSPITFVASANCGRYLGADIDFVDIDPFTYNLNMEALAKKLEQAERDRTLPDLLVPVHLAGQSCQMHEIQELGQKYGFSILEDASHAVGASYDDQPVGNCIYSDAAVFSFHPVKIIATGEGGMILTNREDLADQLRRLRSHGISRDESKMENVPDGPWYYEQLEMGYNYRMSDLQAALGTSQMEKLGRFLTRRRELAARYNAALADLPVRLPYQHPETHSSWHLYIIRLQLDRIGKSHHEVFTQLRAAGIGVQLHYIPVPRQPYYRRLGFRPEDFPEAESYYREAISLPIFYGLSDVDQDRVCSTLRQLLL